MGVSSSHSSAFQTNSGFLPDRRVRHTHNTRTWFSSCSMHTHIHLHTLSQSHTHHAWLFLRLAGVCQDTGAMSVHVWRWQHLGPHNKNTAIIRGLIHTPAPPLPPKHKERLSFTILCIQTASDLRFTYSKITLHEFHIKKYGIQNRTLLSHIAPVLLWTMDTASVMAFRPEVLKNSLFIKTASYYCALSYIKEAGKPKH